MRRLAPIGFLAAWVLTVGILSPLAAQPAPNTNDPAYWCGDTGLKIEPVTTPFIVPQPAPGTVWTLLVVKAGSGPDENWEVPDPEVGAGYSHPSGQDNSHVILCWEDPSVTTTTASSTTTPGSTSTTLGTTTSTVATTTTAPPTTSTSEPPITTTTTSDPPSTTTTTTDPPQTTTTTVTPSTSTSTSTTSTVPPTTTTIPTSCPPGYELDPSGLVCFPIEEGG